MFLWRKINEIHIKKKLTIVKLKENENNISLNRMIQVITEQPANTIYCEQNGKLQGIISMGDIRKICTDSVWGNWSCISPSDIDVRKGHVGMWGGVIPNTHFTYVLDGEYMKARTIFHEKKHINVLPILDKEGKLLGEFSRWDDLLYGNKSLYKEIENSKIVLIRPSSLFQERKEIYKFFRKHLLLKEIQIEETTPDKIIDYIEKADKILFVDTEERSAFQTLNKFLLGRNCDYEKFQTYGEFLISVKKGEKLLERYLWDIKDKGVFVLNLVVKPNTSEYFKTLRNEIDSRYAKLDKMDSRVPKVYYKDFFDDLYTEDYAQDINNLRLKVAVDTSSIGCSKLMDCKDKYYNVVNGERHTVEQPEIYDKTIYFIGGCTIFGLYVEDKNTIASLLQKRLNYAEYKIKVVNCGSVGYWPNTKTALTRIMSIPLKKGDVIVLSTKAQDLQEIPELNLLDILEKHNISAKWMLDMPLHCNHKVHALYADAIFEFLQPILSETVSGQGKCISENIDVVKHIYIDQYFSDCDFSNYKKVGSIVMNCNPFTYGHRYLIEQALSWVDFLIIFVVEEDKSVFSFTERFVMVSEGTADLEHVMVVPSGSFILSQTTFPEYFIKEADEDIVKNVENDITIFAEKIAPHLHINYRFVGEEPEDIVTKEYNEAMKRILPKYGIELIEIPRKEQDGKYISASAVRKCLQENNMKSLKKLVPETTRRILFMENK